MDYYSRENLYNYYMNKLNDKISAVSEIRSLDSWMKDKPETIIRCKDCAYWKNNYCKMLDIHNHFDGDAFCSWGSVEDEEED